MKKEKKKMKGSRLKNCENNLKGLTEHEDGSLHD